MPEGARSRGAITATIAAAGGRQPRRGVRIAPPSKRAEERREPFRSGALAHAPNGRAPESRALTMPPAAAAGGQAVFTSARRLRHAAGIALPITALALALWVLQHAASGTDYRAVVRGVHGIAPARLALACLLAAASYAVLALLEGLALRQVGVSLSARRTALASFTASAIGHTLGFPLVTGGAVRYRLLGAWGVNARRSARALAVGAVAFWVGLASAAAVLLLLGGGATAALALRLPRAVVLGAGLACAAVPLAYLALAAARPAGVRVRAVHVRPPRLSIALGQVVLSLLDWSLAGAILYALLPPDSVALPTVLGVFLLAQLGGLLSHVPAGIGVVETAAVALLAPWLPAQPVLVALLLYRAIYYAAPLALACVLLARRELLPYRGRLRAGAALTTLGAVVLAAAAALARLLRPVQPPTARPSADDIERAARIAAAASATSAHLALLGDKALLFNDAGTAFLMYAVSGQSWVAMGPPVGPPGERAELAWRFRELAHRYGGRTAFYLVPPGDLPLYLDLGLTLLKLGESARVPLASFALDGGGRKWLRRARKAALDAGCSFEVVAAETAARLLPELRRVSDAWLAAKRTREKGFSLGYFDEPYLRRLPVAVVRRAGEVVAFANLWAGGGRDELSVDLMRYSDDAPAGVTDYLFCELLLWGKAEGYCWFDLGMAPLSGLEARALAPLWTRVGGLVYRRGEAIYHFRGLRHFKEKFDPVWEPRYLATPGGMALPAVLADVTALVSRGLGGAVRR